ncbi:TetR/AcrR family transcriptional regulator [Microlunatus parietis]|uniref:AcrR family transcriptional regulator n=1 Tax=Microlunatus parietis TaxID=682979 RepID=A0A7Y9IA81_9ACTN|nr:TetR/AcrR family transcriptional regulator [Microlunatus parietis]NYE73134.1 AcrR family transcriptional regulator [Microlunatus parietis]
MPDHRRADARRNYALILAVAEEEVSARGADASLEQIARTAGVGSATVRRHFPTRQALLEAVSRQRIDDLADRARDLTGTADSRSVLLTWLREVVAYCVTARGLAAALSYGGLDHDPVYENSCTGVLLEAGAPLLESARADGFVAPGVTLADLITLIVGIALATAHHPDPAGEADRLFDLVVAGASPTGPDEGQSIRSV